MIGGVFRGTTKKLSRAYAEYRLARIKSDKATKQHTTVAKGEKAAADELRRVIEDVAFKLNR